MRRLVLRMGWLGASWRTVFRIVDRTATGVLVLVSFLLITRRHSVGRKVASFSASSAACSSSHGIRTLIWVPFCLLFGLTTRDPIRGKVTVLPTVSTSASRATLTISFSPMLNRPLLLGWYRFGVCFISVQASDMSAKPGPSSVTMIRVASSRCCGLISTVQMVASGASSQAF